MKKTCLYCGGTVPRTVHDSNASYEKKRYCSTTCGVRGTRSRPLKERFIDKVDKTVSPPCWIWTAATGRMGYGQIGKGRKLLQAHRVSWRLFRGPIPVGLMILHECDVSGCVNPDHLFLGTHEDNMRDRREKGRLSRGEEHGSAKLDWAKVKVIKRELKRGVTLAFLARKYGVHSSTIRDIKIGKTWTRR